MKYELRTKAWFIDDGKIIQGLITKRELLEVDDHSDGQSTIRRYWLRTSWQGPLWVDEENLYPDIESCILGNKVQYTG